MTTVRVADDADTYRAKGSLASARYFRGTNERSSHFPIIEIGGWNMKKSLFAAALVGIIATPAFADEVGVRVGPVGAGVTVGESHDRDRDRDRTTVIKEREPTDRTTVIKKEDSDGTRSKTVIHDNN
jgi:hypothetical protein